MFVRQFRHLLITICFNWNGQSWLSFYKQKEKWKHWQNELVANRLRIDEFVRTVTRILRWKLLVEIVRNKKCCAAEIKSSHERLIKQLNSIVEFIISFFFTLFLLDNSLIFYSSSNLIYSPHSSHTEGIFKHFMNFRSFFLKSKQRLDQKIAVVVVVDIFDVNLWFRFWREKKQPKSIIITAFFPYLLTSNI